MQLVSGVETREDGLAVAHFRKDTTHTPHVNLCIVAVITHDNIGRTVPQRDNLVRVGGDGHAVTTSEAKVSELELTVHVNQQILRLEIAVEDVVVMAKGETLQQLVHK